MYRNMIWDFDGTLFDTYTVMSTALEQTFQDFGLNVPYEEIYDRLKIAVSGAIKYYQQTYHLGPEFKEKYVARRNMIELDQCPPFPHVVELLKFLHEQGKHNYIFTHRGVSTYPFLEKYNLSPYFTQCITSADGLEKKPSPQAINYLIERYQLNPSETIMIGDRELDIQSGVNANIDTCFFDDQGQTCSIATYSIQSIKDLYSIL